MRHSKFRPATANVVHIIVIDIVQKIERDPIENCGSVAYISNSACCQILLELLRFALHFFLSLAIYHVLGMNVAFKLLQKTKKQKRCNRLFFFFTFATRISCKNRSSNFTELIDSGMLSWNLIYRYSSHFASLHFYRKIESFTSSYQSVCPFGSGSLTNGKTYPIHLDTLIVIE